MQVLKALYRLLGSYGLACVILILLLILTLLGTLEQEDRSIYDVQREYFESTFVVSRVLGRADDGTGGFPIVLPGAYLLLTLLSVNLLVGGMIRIRKKGRTVGILICHVGIAVLLVGGLIEYHYSTKGNMQIWEGDSNREFKSYYLWELAIVERKSDGSIREFVAPHEQFAELDEDGHSLFQSDDLPFDVELRDFKRNSRPVPAGRGARGVDGFLLADVAPDQKAERNAAGLYATIIDKKTQSRTRAILWGWQAYPHQLSVGGTTYDLDLRKQSYPLPFALDLNRFVYEQHPGSMKPKEFSSYVTRRAGKSTEDVHITMNEPFRHGGYTFYQSGWGPQGIPSAHVERWYTVFSVVKNPADIIPEIACYLIALGLLIHFLYKLALYIIRETSKGAA